MKLRGAITAVCVLWSAQAMLANPTISNIVIDVELGGIVNIYYDLSEVSNYACIVSVEYDQLTNGTFTFKPTTSLSGDAGALNPVVPGTNKHIIWDFNKDFTNGAIDTVSTNTVRVKAVIWTLTGIFVDGARHAYSAPYLLDFDFTLRAANTNPIALPPALIKATCTENGQPISPSETAHLLAQGRKSLACFLTLDYSRSMKISTNADGVSAIVSMQEAALSFLEAFQSGYDSNMLQANVRVGVAESHADDIEPHIVAPLSGDKAYLTEAIEGIISNHVQNYYAGTRWRDAVYTSLVAVAESGDNPDEVRSIIFLSDGVDESSFATTNDIVTYALANKIRIYTIGFGKELSQGQPTLMAIANRTGGRYFVATNQAAISEQFTLLAQELKALYTLRWATLKRAPATAFVPAFTISAQGRTAASTPVFPSYQPTNYAGDVRQGALTYLISPQNEASQRVSVVVYCSYAPRQIRQIWYHLLSRFPYTFSIVREADSGLLPNDWLQTNVPAAEANAQWLIASSPNPDSDTSSEIVYGGFGAILHIVFTNVTDYLALLIDLNTSYVDSSVYQNIGGMSFNIAPIPNLPDPELTYTTNVFNQAGQPQVWDISGTYRLNNVNILTTKGTFEAKQLQVNIASLPSTDEQGKNATWGSGKLIVSSSITKATYTLECARIELKVSQGKGGLGMAWKIDLVNAAYGNIPAGSLQFKGMLDYSTFAVGGSLKGSLLVDGVKDALPTTIVAFNLPKQPQDGTWQLQMETKEEAAAKGVTVTGAGYAILSSGTKIAYEVKGMRKSNKTTSSLNLLLPGANKPALIVTLDEKGNVLTLKGTIEGQRVAYKR